MSDGVVVTTEFTGGAGNVVVAAVVEFLSLLHPATSRAAAIAVPIQTSRTRMRAPSGDGVRRQKSSHDYCTT